MSETLVTVMGVISGAVAALSAMAFYYTNSRIRDLKGPIARVLWLTMLVITLITGIEGFSGILEAYYYAATGNYNVVDVMVSILKGVFILVALFTATFTLKIRTPVLPRGIHLVTTDFKGSEPKNIAALRLISQHILSVDDAIKLAMELGALDARRVLETTSPEHLSLWDIADMLSRELNLKQSLKVEGTRRIVGFSLPRSVYDEKIVPIVVSYVKGLWEAMASRVLNKPVEVDASITPIGDGVLVELVF